MNKYIAALILALAIASPAMAAKHTTPAPVVPAARCANTQGDFAEFLAFVTKTNDAGNVEATVLTPEQVTALEGILGVIPEKIAAKVTKVVVIHNDQAAIIALVDAQDCLVGHTKATDYRELGAAIGLIRA